MTSLLLVAAGGSFGAVARYLVDFWTVSRGISRLPLGTLVVNVSGSFGAGLLVGMLGAADDPDLLMTTLGAGFLGAYTTFSTWMFGSARLIQRGAVRAALVNLVGTVVLGLAAAVIGLMLAAGAGGSL